MTVKISSNPIKKSTFITRNGDEIKNPFGDELPLNLVRPGGTATSECGETTNDEQKKA